MALATTPPWTGRRLHMLLPDLPAAFRTGNARWFASEIARREIEVWASPLHSIGLAAGELTLRGTRLQASDLEASTRTLRIGTVPVEVGDLIWVLGRPAAAMSKDVFSILRAALRSHPFVNTPSALALLDSKASVHVVAHEFAIPESLITSSLAVAAARHRDAQTDLIAKPLVGDSGGSVYVVRPGDSNADVILQTLTGDAAAKPTLYPSSVHGLQTKFAVMQPRIARLPEAEKRVIIAGGVVIATIPKHIQGDSHRATTSGPEVAEPASLTASELEMCQRVADRLRDAGVLFAGLDISKNYVVEINIFNPGGLSRLSPAHLDRSVKCAVDQLHAALVAA